MSRAASLPPPTIAPSSASTSWKSALRSPCPNSNAKPQTGKLKVKHRTAKKRFLGRGRAHQGVHPRRRCLSGRSFAALRRRARGRQLPGLSRAAHRQSQPLHVLSALRAGGTAGRAKTREAPPKDQKARRRLNWPARRPSCWCACTRATWSTGPSPARGRAAPPRPRTMRSPKRCCTTRRSAPST